SSTPTTSRSCGCRPAAGATTSASPDCGSRTGWTNRRPRPRLELSAGPPRSAIMPLRPVGRGARRAVMSSPVEPAPPGAPFDPAALGLGNVGRVWANPPPAALTEHATRRNEALLTDLGAGVADTGNAARRSPQHHV